MSDELLVPAIHVPHDAPARAVWRLAWPAVALNSLQTLNALLDSAFVSRLGGSSLTATGGATTSVFLVVSLSMSLGVAATALVSRAFGAEDAVDLRESSNRSLSFAIIVGLILFAFAWLFAPVAAEWFLPSTEHEASRLLVAYLRMFAFALPGLCAIQSISGSLRGIGDTVSPMVISGVQIAFHIVLNFLMMFPGVQLGPVWIPGANLALPGAGLAFTISTTLSAVAYAIWSQKTDLGKLRLKIPSSQWAMRIARLAGPAGFMNVIRVTSLMGYTAILKQVPTAAAAIGALRPAFSIESFAFMPPMGLGIAAAALVGQSLGMKDPERASKIGWTAAHHAAIVAGIMAVFLYFFARPITSVMLNGHESYVVEATNYLRLICFTEVLFAYSMVLTSAQQGAGDTVKPMWQTFITMWFIRVPLAAYLALSQFGPIRGLNLGAEGCWISITITQAISGCIALVLWKSGSWKTAKV